MKNWNPTAIHYQLKRWRIAKKVRSTTFSGKQFLLDSLSLPSS